MINQLNNLNWQSWKTKIPMIVQKHALIKAFKWWSSEIFALRKKEIVELSSTSTLINLGMSDYFRFQNINKKSSVAKTWPWINMWHLQLVVVLGSWTNPTVKNFLIFNLLQKIVYETSRTIKTLRLPLIRQIRWSLGYVGNFVSERI